MRKGNGQVMEQPILKPEATTTLPAQSPGEANTEEPLSGFRGRGSARTQRLVVPALIASDVLIALMTWTAASLFQDIWGRGPVSQATIHTVLAGIAVWIGLRTLLGLYPGYGMSRVEELRRQTYAVLTAAAIVAVFAVMSQVGDLLSRMLLLLGFSGLLFAAPFGRYFAKRSLVKLGVWGKPVVLVGCGSAGVRVVRLLKQEWELGLNPVAVFDDLQAPEQRRIEDVPYRGTMTEALRLAAQQHVDTLIFAMPYTRRQHLIKYVELARLHVRHVMVIPNLGGITNSSVVARDLGGLLGLEIRHNLLDHWALRTKRVMDFVATLIGGALIFPLIIALCALVWLETRSNIFYKAQRMGRDGRLFSCVKFRTMVPDAEAELQRLLDENEELREEYSKYHKLRNDPRVTRTGRFLRKTSLDELPQLWNVMRGDMSLVGPRPYLPRESMEIGETQAEILRVPPGITGPWQVSGRHHTSFGERVRIDADYVHNWSVWLDLMLLARTVKKMALDRDGC
ncbi:MAG: undecaprenyl-phosphate galactose phosphotransferase WbaP [Rubrobacter sp.]|nr:undecaprenyl-phosphate galactose phosphotransferase WbaP [Rubrobacter sp.]